MKDTLPRDLYSAAQVRELDRRAIDEQHIPGYTLMCRAGAAALGVLRERWPQARDIVVVCGAGNNGGDGYVVARLAKQAGMASRVVALHQPDSLKGDALRAYGEAQQAAVKTQSFDARALAGDVVVDAIFGTGLNRAVDGVWREAIAAINERRRSQSAVLALDIPSGLHADSGAVLGEAVLAEATISFIGLKQGLFTGQAAQYCGTIYFDALQLPAALYRDLSPSAQRYAGHALERLLPKRSRTAHKGDHGHAVVVGGNRGMSGAPRLSAEAAARCGAGLVSIAARDAQLTRPEFMVHRVIRPDTDSGLRALLERASVVAIGPGLGTDRWGRQLLDAVLSRAKPLPMVADADALNLLAENPVRREDWVLTPHPGEAARLLNATSRDIQADRYAAASAISQRYGGVCLLKGAGTLIAADQRTTAVVTSGNPGMASGGMGDVLTGVIAGLIAQGLAPFAAARDGAYIHGRAADLAAADGERGLLATDLMPFLRRLVNPPA